jgi:hypothetical protein
MDKAQWKWEELYLKAFLETDPSNLPNRIADAEKAIASRTTELHTSEDGEMEWQAIQDAVKGLLSLKREIRTSMGAHATGRLPLRNL